MSATTGDSKSPLLRVGGGKYCALRHDAPPQVSETEEQAYARLHIAYVLEVSVLRELNSYASHDGYMLQ